MPIETYCASVIPLSNGRETRLRVIGTMIEDCTQ